MSRYTLEKYDFKKFLLEELKDTRQEELIFWKRNIPMPVDLIYEIFERRGSLLAKYLDHIGSAFLIAYALKNDDSTWKSEFELHPTKKNIPEKDYFINIFHTYQHESCISSLLIELSEMLLLRDYSFNEIGFYNAICHEGRKYKRFYLPNGIKNKIALNFPELLTVISQSNGDMFSNVVADELKIYRMGFADAFTGIFNKMIDFILQNSVGLRKGYSSASSLKITQNPQEKSTEKNKINYGVVSDGCIWEPTYVDAKLSFTLNTRHPFSAIIKQGGSQTEEIMAEIIDVMSTIENNCVRDSERRTLQIFRQDISKELRIRTEENI
jgi:hypothetical protein